MRSSNFLAAARNLRGKDRGVRPLIALVWIALVLSVGGWIATLAVESPREAAANAGPPDASLITVPAEKREVAQEVVTRGVVSADQEVEVLSELVAAGARRRVVSSALPERGAQVRAGKVVAEVSGRPIFAMQGAVAAYRDLKLGDSGSDVRQLNAALAAAGYAVSRTSAEFGQPTRAALFSMYRDAGYASDGELPAGEVAFVSKLPAAITSVSGDLGSPAADASVRVSSGALVIRADGLAAGTGEIRAGTAVEVTSEVLGKTIAARVRGAEDSSERPEKAVPNGAESDAPESEANDAPGSGVLVISPDEPLPIAWAGQDVRVRIVSASSGAKVLAVPVTAIFRNGSGDDEVLVAAMQAASLKDAEIRRVRVTTGVVGGGWVEIRTGKVVAGDLVVLSGAD